MKISKFIISLIKRIPVFRRLDKAINKIYSLNSIDVQSINQQLQRIIVNQYNDALHKGIMPYKRVSEAGFRCYSQFEEDGIILYILTLIGMKTRKVVEICCGNGEECMSANLILNHGYEGFLFDGDGENVISAVSFFKSKQDCRLTAPKVKHAWITKDNINSLLKDIGAKGEVDLLSLDIDGNDYYIWEAISQINPRLCVFETQDVIPGDLSLTIPYDESFKYWEKEGSAKDFRSVSLLAMKSLSAKKGYRLIGAHKHGFNVFFLRNDIGQDIFPEVSIAEVHDNLWTRYSQSERWPLVKNMNWVKV